jgi:hypothetical protein
MFLNMCCSGLSACSLLFALCCSQVALKAARLACEAHPSSAAAWQLRLQQEAAAKGSKPGSSSSGAAAGPGQLLAVIKQGLQHVPTAEAEQLWLQVGAWNFGSAGICEDAGRVRLGVHLL